MCHRFVVINRQRMMKIEIEIIYNMYRVLKTVAISRASQLCHVGSLQVTSGFLVKNRRIRYML
jgi:hypothetical protein